MRENSPEKRVWGNLVEVLLEREALDRDIEIVTFNTNQYMFI